MVESDEEEEEMPVVVLDSQSYFWNMEQSFFLEQSFEPLFGWGQFGLGKFFRFGTGVDLYLFGWLLYVLILLLARSWSLKGIFIYFFLLLAVWVHFFLDFLLVFYFLEVLLFSNQNGSG